MYTLKSLTASTPTVTKTTIKTHFLSNLSQKRARTRKGKKNKYCLMLNSQMDWATRRRTVNVLGTMTARTRRSNPWRGRDVENQNYPKMITISQNLWKNKHSRLSRTSSYRLTTGHTSRTTTMAKSTRSRTVKHTVALDRITSSRLSLWRDCRA